MTQSHAVTGSVQGTYTAVSCMPCTDEETFNYVKHPVGTIMSENGSSNKCPLKATNSDEKLKKAEESTQRPTARPVVDKKGTPSKHEAHACKQVPPIAQSHAVTGSIQGTYTAVSCMPCIGEESIIYAKQTVGTTMSENGPSDKCPLKATNSDEKLKMAEESTQRPTTRPVVDKKGTPSKHEAHACKQVPPLVQSHAVTGSLQGTYSAVSCMLGTDEDIFNDVHSVGTTMNENGPSNKCPLKAMNSDEKLKKAEESTQRPTTRPVEDKKGTPSKHEAHACKQVPPMAQSHAVTGAVQGTHTAVSCIPCGHGCYRCQRCKKCSLCGNKDVLINCSINRVAVCSKSYKSKTHYFNESVIQCYPCTECCGKDKVNIEPVPLKRKEKDSGAPAGKSVVVLKSSDVTIRNNSVFMPNTIEMARLKKKENGQFVTNVQISSKMSQQDIRELLISLFHYLGDQR